MDNINWDNVQDASNPTPGAYPAKIVKVEDRTDKQYLMVSYEIVQGNYKDYCQDTYDRIGFWPFRQCWSYKQKAWWFFKQKKLAIEASNKGFIFKNEPQSLVGKYCYILVGEEEYRKHNGSKGRRLTVTDIISVNEYKAGRYEIPELKRLPEEPAPEPTYSSNDYAPIEEPDEQLPF